MNVDSRKICWLAIFICVAGVALPGPSASSDDALFGIALQAADALGYDEASIRKLMAGEMVSHQLNDEEKKELALTIAVKVPRSPKEVFADLVTKAFFEIDRSILEWGVIEEAPASAASFAELMIRDKELDRLLKVDAGNDFNLSEEEIASLQATTKKLRGQSKAERRAGIMQAYRELLAARVEAYRAAGIAGIARYHRGRKYSNPAQDLLQALPASSSLIAREAPEFYDRLSASSVRTTSGRDSEGVDVQLIWLLQELNGRQAVVLAHRVVGRDPRNTYFAQRDFYVSHTFDALQILVGVLRLGPEESVVFYTNRTYTEQVAGFASSAAHKIGRKMLEKEVRTMIESVLAKYRADAPRS